MISKDALTDCWLQERCPIREFWWRVGQVVRHWWLQPGSEVVSTGLETKRKGSWSFSLSIPQKSATTWFGLEAREDSRVKNTLPSRDFKGVLNSYRRNPFGCLYRQVWCWSSASVKVVQGSEVHISKWGTAAKARPVSSATRRAEPLRCYSWERPPGDPSI